MSPIEERVASLLDELAEARPVRVGTPPPADRAGSAPAREPRPDYVTSESPAARPRRRPVLVAAAVLLVVALVGGLLTLGRGGGRTPVVASLSDLPVDTSLLGGGRMAVVVDNQLHVADGPTAQVWQLTDTGRGEEVSNVSFSHDGEWVAFTIHDESGLWISRWDGSEQHRIGRAPSSYAWSPTANELAYATQDEVRIARTDGSSWALRVATDPRPFTRVVWSPAGTGVAFVHLGGGTTREALDDTAEPEWGSVYTVPATEVLAWPTAERLAVAGWAQAPNATLSVALMLSVETQDLAEIPSSLDVGTLDGGQRIAALSFGSPEVVDCDTVELTCRTLPLEEGYLQASVPSHAPSGERLAIIGQGIGEQVLQVVDLDGRVERIALGPWVDPASGLVLEPPVWRDDDSLFVRAHGRVLLVTIAPDGGATSALVLNGDRFLSPEDDYPGGTGLTYWAPR